jgi:23S rRNA (cytosine1962-C5)-methyltransferase
MDNQPVKTSPQPALQLLVPSDWTEYELLDSGNGLKLERYGPYTFVRPAHQAVWRPSLSSKEWEAAHAVFQPTREESGGHWRFEKPIQPPTWTMHYKKLTFRVQTTAARHLGIFPEQAPHWDWSADLIRASQRPVQVLNLFGYTGAATLAAAQAGARVTHVDASKKSVKWARENQSLSNLDGYPIRWIVDDAIKFIRREERRGNQYDGLILDPPKFGRGPKGEVWEFFDLMPNLLDACRSVLGPRPLFIVITAYAIQASALSLYYGLQEVMAGIEGTVSAGELALAERSAGRLISTAIYARWEAKSIP